MVGGSMRSGTTVIHRALCQAKNSNPFISESWYLLELMGIHERGVTRFDMRAKDQFGEVEAFEDFIRRDIQAYFAAIANKYGNPEVLILKHPELTKNFATLKRLAPQMKFLVVVRDPRDVVASMKNVIKRHRDQNLLTPFTRSLQTMNDYCAHYIGYYGKLFAERESIGEDLMIVRYEDVVTDPVDAFSKIGAFSGAVYEGDAMKSYDPDETESKYLVRDERVKDKISEAFWSEMYTKELSADSVRAYKDILTLPEVNDIESTLAQVGKTWGYW